MVGQKTSFTDWKSSFKVNKEYLCIVIYLKNVDEDEILR